LQVEKVQYPLLLKADTSLRLDINDLVTGHLNAKEHTALWTFKLRMTSARQAMLVNDFFF